MQHLLDMDWSDFRQRLSQLGVQPYRAAQIYGWLYQKRATEFGQMTDLARPLRTMLAENFTLWTLTVQAQHQSADGTQKLLMQLHDGGQIECVLLRDGLRRTICISTQVGCAMGCVFCASGIGGVQRNLSTGEILEQMLHLARLLPHGERLSHIVVMGMGEPLANVEHLLPALDVASRPEGLGISARRITISTVGLPAAIDRLSDRSCRYHLAVSLHAPTDELRSQLVPVNQTIGLRSILQAADRYFQVSGRRLTFEYVLLAGINDQPHQATQLAELLQKRAALVNLIPYNRVAGLPYRTPLARAVRDFRQILERSGLTVKVRQRKGDKISAACGQLRRDTGTLPTVRGWILQT